jgi:hypothetical protein
MAEARRTQFPQREADPGKREGGSPPVALFPPTGMRFSPIVSIRAGNLGEGHGKFIRFAARFDGKEIQGKENPGREEPSKPRTTISGDDLFCEELF